MILRNKFFLLLLLSSFLSAQDSVKVSLPALDREIKLRQQEWEKAVQEAEQAKLKAAYLQGAVEMLKLKRIEFSDTTKTK